MIELDTLSLNPSGAPELRLVNEFTKALDEARRPAASMVQSEVTSPPTGVPKVAFQEPPSPQRSQSYSLHDLGERVIQLDQAAMTYYTDYISGRQERRLAAKYGLVNSDANQNSGSVRELDASSVPMSGVQGGQDGAFSGGPGTFVSGASSRPAEGSGGTVVSRTDDREVVRMSGHNSKPTVEELTNRFIDNQRRVDDLSVRIANKQIEQGYALAEVNMQLSARAAMFTVAMSAKELAGKLMNKLTSGS